MEKGKFLSAHKTKKRIYKQDNLSRFKENADFDETFAPDDWNFERDGTPDIVFGLHNGDDVSNVL